MNVCIIQPPYSRDVSFSDEYFQYKLSCLEQCDESVDLIVLPEYSDVPCATSTLEGIRYGFLTCYDFYFYDMEEV